MFSMHLPSDKHKNAFCWAFSLLTFLTKNINAQKKTEPNAVGNDTKYKQWVKSLCSSGVQLNKLFQKCKNTVPVQTLEHLIMSHFYVLLKWSVFLQTELLQNSLKQMQFRQLFL